MNTYGGFTDHLPSVLFLLAGWVWIMWYCARKSREPFMGRGEVGLERFAGRPERPCTTARPGLVPSRPPASNARRSRVTPEKRPAVPLSQRNVVKRVTESDHRLRFLTLPRSASGCWIWQQYRNRFGYGLTKLDQKPLVAHRFAYELLVGPIPDGLELDHLCHTADRSCPGGTQCPHRRCVNPFHLEPVTPAENNRRKHRHPPSYCPLGHPYDEANTRVRHRPDGVRRECRACHRLAMSAYNARKRAQPASVVHVAYDPAWKRPTL